MPSHRAFRSVLSPVGALLLVCGGCTDRGGDEPKAVNTAPYLQTARSQEEARILSSGGPPERDGQGQAAAEAEPPRTDEDLSLLMGERDTSNRFQSAVIIITDVPNSRWKSTQCSGVLVAPRQLRGRLLQLLDIDGPVKDIPAWKRLVEDVNVVVARLAPAARETH